MNLISSFRFLKRKQGGLRELTDTHAQCQHSGRHTSPPLSADCLLFSKGWCASIYGQAPLTRLAGGAGPAYTGSHACYILSLPPTVILKHLQVSVLKGLPVYPLLHRKSTKSDSMSRSNVRSQHTCFLEQQAT